MPKYRDYRAFSAATGCQGSFEDLWQTFRVNQGSPILVDEDISHGIL
jgi:hypothetical protein